MRRKIRRAVRVRSWPWRTKLAVGAWVPAVVVAAALFTGPNRPATTADAADAKTSTTRAVPKIVAKPVHVPDTVPFESVLGSWIKAAGYRRAATYSRMARRHKAPRIMTTHPGRRR
jgi:hypothetical protein